MSRSIVIVFALLNSFMSFAHELSIINECRDTIWIGLLGNVGQKLLANGGFQLNAGRVNILGVPAGWSGRIWARTHCKNGHCQTGDCGGVECNGKSGEPPASLVQIAFNGGKDTYDVSLVDGFNLPVSITPVDGTYISQGTGSKFDCGTAGCYSDINKKCPDTHAVRKEGKTVACKNHRELFKSECPNANAFPSDGTSFSCTNKSPGVSSYKITFCHN